MNIVKCPNPSCPFQFDATLVPPGAVIACPQCRLQFQLPQVAAAPLQPAPATEPEVLDEEPEVGEKTERAGRRRQREDDTPRRSGRPRGGGNAAAIIVVLVVGLAFVCGGGIAGVFVVIGMLQKKPSNTSPYTYPEYTLSYNGPGEGWQEDEGTRTYMKVNLACFKSTSPEAYIAVQAMKTEGEAAKGDLLPAAVARLKEKFEDLDEDIKPVEVKFLGTMAEKYEFIGVYKASEIGCRGEVYAVAVRNLKVWVYCWGERDKFDQLAPMFEAFRAGLKVESKANEPKIQRPKTDFRTNNGLYTLTDTEGLWKKQEDPTRKDGAADLWLAGFERNAATGQLKQKPNADLVVAILDPMGDAKEQAKAHIIAQDTEGGVVQEQTGDPVGESPSSGPVAATDDVVRFSKKYPDTTGSADKMIVFRVVDSGGKRLVVYAWCQFKDASYWEQRMMLVVGTLKALK